MCEKPLNFRSKLLKHLSSHTELDWKKNTLKKTEDPDSPIIHLSVICKAELRTADSMTTVHIEPHLQCPKCEKAFHFRGRLQKHIEQQLKQAIEKEQI